MRVEFVDFKSNLIYKIVTSSEGPVCIPGIGSMIKLPDNKQYTVIKSFIDYSKLKTSDHFHLSARLTIKEIPGD